MRFRTPHRRHGDSPQDLQIAEKGGRLFPVCRFRRFLREYLVAEADGRTGDFVGSCLVLAWCRRTVNAGCKAFSRRQKVILRSSRCTIGICGLMKRRRSWISISGTIGGRARECRRRMLNDSDTVVVHSESFKRQCPENHRILLEQTMGMTWASEGGHATKCSRRDCGCEGGAQR